MGELRLKTYGFYILISEKLIMRAGPKLGVDAYGVSGFTRL
jgi:hypothetical protein